MTIDRRLIAGALGLSLALAACGGSSTATATPVSSATAAPATPAPTAAAPSDTPDATETTTSGPEPSFMPGAAGDLEAMLPDEAAGVKFEKTSFDGASLGLFGGTIDTAELDPILKANGKTINDVRVAIAGPADASTADGGTIIAFQIRGLDASKFMEALGVDAATMTKTTIGGKEVLSSGAAGFSIVIYAKDDVLFEILLASDAVTEAIVSQLP